MGMVLDGIGTSEAIDSSGELLELKGLDISDLVEGRGVLNTEHRGEDAAGYSFLDIIGRVITAKKLYTRDDCENERQRKYWDQVKLPYLYIKCELFDSDEDGDHPAAKAAAAQIRHYNRRGLPILIRYSIEGNTLVMEDKVIKQSIARRVAATIKPANKSCTSGILEDERAKPDRSKGEGSFEGGPGGVLEDSLSMTKFERPDAHPLGRSVTMAWDPEVDDVTEDFMAKAQAVIDLAKAMSGQYVPASPNNFRALPVGAIMTTESGHIATKTGDDAWTVHISADQKLGLPPKHNVSTYKVTGFGERWYHQNPAMQKTIAAGSYNAAPGTLTGGAALQREDLGEDHRRLVSVCKAAIRDHDPETHGPFKTYLKSLLPEASEEFLERFDQLADELDVKGKLAYLKKGQAPAVIIPPEHQSAPSKPENYRGTRVAGKPVTPRSEREADYQETLSRIKESRATAFPDEDAGGVIPPAETPAFKRVKPREEMKYGKVEVDTKRGVLYIGGTGEGATRAKPAQAYKLHAPTDSAYMDIMSAPENNVHHDRAMDNWVTVHRLLRQGVLPSPLIAHTAMYTLMAPNEGGPIQDLSYALFQDLVAKGFDPMKGYDPDELGDWEKEFGDMAVGQYHPQYMHDHFAQDASNIWRKPTPKELESGNVRSSLYTAQPLSDFGGPEGRLRSSVGKLSLGDKPQPGKWNTVAKYHHTHTFLDRLVRQHGADADKVMEEFLNQKKADPKFGFGFGIKTARYTGGMLGMGKHVVPDTHFIRHLFGLHPDDPRIGDVKGIFAGDSPAREVALRGVDEWFRRYHPAFQWTRQKLQKRYGEDFGEHATFPAFWHHWTLIPLHERARQWPAGQAENMGTDHEVFWNSARNILRQFGLPTDPHDPRLRKKEAWKQGGSLSARTVHAMKAMEDRFGPVGASLFFYHSLAPLLLAPTKTDTLYKAELLARLAKGEYSEDSEGEHDQPGVVMHQGRAINPGEVEFVAGPQQGNRLRLVSIGKDYHHVLSPTGKLMKLKANHPAIKLIRQPTILRARTQVDSKLHGHPTLHGTQGQHDIIHGLDLSKKVSDGAVKGVTSQMDTHGVTGWYQSGEGHHVYVKPAIDELMASGSVPQPEEGTEFTVPHREAAYYRLAHDFFGLGEHVPTTTLFRHPVTQDWHSAQERVEGEHYSPGSMFHKEMLGQMARAGTLDKLAFMDMLMGQSDRHRMNGIISPDGDRLHLIDNGLSFAPTLDPEYRHHAVPPVSEFWYMGHKYNDGKLWYNKPLNPATSAWLQSLDPQKLAQHADRIGMPKSFRDEMVRRLMAVQKRVGRRSVSRVAAYYSPFLGPVEKPTYSDLDEHGFISGGGPVDTNGVGGRT